MDNIKQLFINRFRTFTLLSISMTFCIVLLMIRMKLTHSFFYLFLVWNLFLAIIPFVITTYLVSLPKLNKFVLAFWFGGWLLFLPNAPYIVTDLIHIRLSNTRFVWLDVIVVTSFALNGLILFYLSFLDMISLLNYHVKKQYVSFSIPVLIFLSAFGVYLGRFLRYNSWEIIQNPLELFNDIFRIIIYPSKHIEAWQFTILSGAFLCIGFWIYNDIRKNN